MSKKSWLDESKQTPLIDEYAHKLTTFVAALADGQIDAQELSAQEQRVVKLLTEVEPLLSDGQHETVTKLLCELTAYNVMQTLHSLQAGRPKTKFVG